MDVKIHKQKRTKKKHIIISAIVVVFVLLVLTAVFSNQGSTYKIEADKIRTSSALETEFKDYISIVGTVEPITTIYLDAIEGGRVDSIISEEGTMVQKGDVILTLSNNQLNLSILNTEAQLAEQINFLRNTQIQMEQEKIRLKQERLSLEFDVKQKLRKYTRNQTLVEKGAVSQEDYLLSKEAFELTQKTLELVIERQEQDSLFRLTQISQMNQNLEKMRLNLELVHQRLDNLHVKAPSDGQLGLLDAVVGQSVRQGQRVGQINVLSSYKVVAEVDEHYIDRVKLQLPAQISDTNNEHTLKVKKIFPEIRNGKFDVNLTFSSETPDNIRTGKTYHLELQLGAPKRCLVIPRGGYFNSTGGQWVYVIDKSGEFATKRNIKIGKQNPLYYEVLDGLMPGEQIISSSYEQFKNADKIKLK